MVPTATPVSQDDPSQGENSSGTISDSLQLVTPQTRNAASDRDEILKQSWHF